MPAKTHFAKRADMRHKPPPTTIPHPPTMPTRSEDFSGLSVAMITPFRDGQVDTEALQRNVEFQIAAGTTCLCPAGTTGESPTLSHPSTSG